MNSSILSLTWLGQSGFLLDYRGVRIACDLYLSDFCRKKSRLDHTRKMPIPVQPESLDDIGHYLVTHGHIDHFDPETVGPVMKANPATVFHCPPACRKIAGEYFPGGMERFHFVNTLKAYQLEKGVSLIALPAAHEELDKDGDGEYIAFAYLLLFEDCSTAVFFCGDSLVYAGLEGYIKAFLPPGYKLFMVLPVNGRDKERAALGFKGNMNMAEAADLCRECGAEMLIPCHFGMFALNDLSAPPVAEDLAAMGVRAMIPEVLKPIVLR